MATESFRCRRRTARARQLRGRRAARRDRGDLAVEPAAAADDLEGRARRWPAATRWWSSPPRRRPRTATLLGEVMNKVGVPKGVYNVVHGFGPDSGRRVPDQPSGRQRRSPSPGRPRTGTAIMRAGRGRACGRCRSSWAARTPALVFADCDFDKAVEGTVTRSASRTPVRCAWAPSGSTWSGRSSTSSSPALKAKARGADARPAGRPGDHDRPADQQGAPGQGAVLLPEGRTRRARRCVTGGGIPDMPEDLTAAAWVQPTIWTGLPETRDGRPARRSSARAATSPRSTPRRRRWRWPTTRNTAWRRRSGPRTSAARHRAGAQIEVGHVLGQHLVPARPAYPVRRLEGVRHRPRGRRALAGVLLPNSPTSASTSKAGSTDQWRQLRRPRSRRPPRCSSRRRARAGPAKPSAPDRGRRLEGAYAAQR